MGVPRETIEEIAREEALKVASTLEGLASACVDLAVTTLIVASLTALFLQAIYEYGWRKSQNQDTTFDWLRRRLDALPDGLKPNAKSSSDGQVMTERDIVEMIGISEDSPIFALPFSHLCAQFSNSLQTAVDLRRSPEVLLVFSGVKDIDTYKAFSPWLDRAPKEGQATGDDTPETPQATTKSLDGEASQVGSGETQDFETEQELLLLLERGVDDLQSELARAWGRSGYIGSFLLTSSLLVVLMLAATSFRPDFSAILLVAVIIVASTLLAPPIQRLLDRLFAARFGR